MFCRIGGFDKISDIGCIGQSLHEVGCVFVSVQSVNFGRGWKQRRGMGAVVAHVKLCFSQINTFCAFE